MIWRHLILLLATLAPLHAAPPEVIDDRFTLTLFAEAPTIRTPVGCALDNRGRLLVIESHTHFAPDGYDGPKTDRILAFTDTDRDGKADKTEIYWEGGKHLMSIAFDTVAGDCYVASRSRIFRITEGTKPGEEFVVARLDTTGDYPHNGLCGLSISIQNGGQSDKAPPAKPTIHFGLGENLGHPYKLIADDGTTLSGGGEGGNIYRIRGDGTRLTQVATGFWNPFGICQARGQLFTVDNDPDSRPPNRLLHVVEGGDYGYQFRYGRPGTHPLQGWDGDFPGTLPMIAGTGEAACSVIPYGDELFVTSWGHHRIEAYQLKTKGASYSATMKTLVRGDKNFRPVGLVANPFGIIYFTDWVDGDYSVHGKGRIWKLTPKEQAFPFPPFPVVGTPIWKSDDPFAHAAIAARSMPDRLEDIIANREKSTPQQKSFALSALRSRTPKPSAATLKVALDDPSPEVQLAAVRCISDQKEAELSEALLALAPRSVGHPRLFDAIATTLKRIAPDAPKLDRESMLLAIAINKYSPALERVTALRRIDPDSKQLSLSVYEELIDDPMPSVADAAVWHLTQRKDKDAKPLLEKLAADGHPDAALLVGEPAAPATHPPRDVGAWLALLEISGDPGDPHAGRRVFFAQHLGMCSRCHTHGGYGNAVGPDLTGIGEREALPNLLESIIAPNKEIAPMFQPVVIEKTDGELIVGLPTHTNGRHGTGAESLVGVSGETIEVPLSDIAARSPWVASLMPPGLDSRLTVKQMRDLIAFLKSST